MSDITTGRCFPAPPTVSRQKPRSRRRNLRDLLHAGSFLNHFPLESHRGGIPFGGSCLRTSYDAAPGEATRRDIRAIAPALAHCSQRFRTREPLRKPHALAHQSPRLTGPAELSRRAFPRPPQHARVKEWLVAARLLPHRTRLANPIAPGRAPERPALMIQRA